MAEDLDKLLQDAAGHPRSPVDGAAIRRRAEDRRRRSAATIAGIVALLLIVPIVGLLIPDDADRVMIDQPTPAHTVGAAVNDAVYRVDVDVEVRVTGELADDVRVVVPTEEGLGHPVAGPFGAASFIVTADGAAELHLQARGPEGIATARVARLEDLDVVIDDVSTTLRPGVPVPVTVDVVPAQEDANPFVLEAPISAALPLRADDGTTGAIEITHTPRAVTGTHLGISGPVDVADQRLPRPDVGEAIATQLEDGRPVWVVGLDDGEVSVVDARSTHTVSGLVGWCGTMPGFIDSPGASRFDARGGYAFGPAPYGLSTYDVQVSQDHVVVTRRLPPAPRPDLSGEGRAPAHIVGSSLTQGRPCEPNSDVPQDGRIIEDYRGQPGWAQHDLSAWPPLQGQPDGWYRTEEVDAPASLVPPPMAAIITGEVLVHRVDGETVDAAGPPGTTQLTLDAAGGDTPFGGTPMLLLSVTEVPVHDCPEEICPYGSVTTIPVMWATPDALLDVTDLTPPHPDAVLYPALPQPPTPRPLAQAARIQAHPSDLVEVALDADGYAVEAVTTVE
jgi:hypothetical protein